MSFFFNDTATTEIYTLSLHDALPILATYGQALGIAFQMSDDIMDLVGKPGLMGKGIGADLAEGTMTLPVIFALREGDAEIIRRVLAAPNPSPELLRSEEHTSELQSRQYLVCRLLL